MEWVAFIAGTCLRMLGDNGRMQKCGVRCKFKTRNWSHAGRDRKADFRFDDFIGRGRPIFLPFGRRVLRLRADQDQGSHAVRWRRFAQDDRAETDGTVNVTDGEEINGEEG
jgi:hypothetical protein